MSGGRGHTDSGVVTEAARRGRPVQPAPLMSLGDPGEAATEPAAWGKGLSQSSATETRL